MCHEMCFIGKIGKNTVFDGRSYKSDLNNHTKVLGFDTFSFWLSFIFANLRFHGHISIVTKLFLISSINLII